MNLTERLAEYFRARPGQWIDGRRLAEVAGAYGWRTRVSNLRAERSMIIENRIRRVPNLTGGRPLVVSEYRLCTYANSAQSDNQNAEPAVENPVDNLRTDCKSRVGNQQSLPPKVAEIAEKLRKICRQVSDQKPSQESDPEREPRRC